jgi:hypothetical protein
VNEELIILRNDLRELKSRLEIEKLINEKREIGNRPNIFPIGQVIDRQGKVPEDFLLLDGRTYGRNQYPLLHSFLSNIVGYRTVTSDTFTLPNTGQLVKSTSNFFAITSGGKIDYPHKLGVIPDFVHYFLKNVISEIGYSPGDIVEIGSNFDKNIATNSDGIGCSSILTDTFIKVQYGVTNTIFHVIDRATAGDAGHCTNANWRFMVKAFAILPTKIIKVR